MSHKFSLSDLFVLLLVVLLWLLLSPARVERFIERHPVHHWSESL